MRGDKERLEDLGEFSTETPPDATAQFFHGNSPDWAKYTPLLGCPKLPSREKGGGDVDLDSALSCASTEGF